MFDNNNNNNIVSLGKTLKNTFPPKKQFLKEVFPGAWRGPVLNKKYLPGLKNPEETCKRIESKLMRWAGEKTQ